MNSAATVADLIASWQKQGLTKAEIVVKAAEACMGWPYVWGGYGQYCTPGNRQSYAQRSSCPEGERQQIQKKCQVLNGTKGSCAGCKYFPNTNVRFFDCRGFTRWLLAQVGISLQGAGATSQWNNESNWLAKGLIRDMPEDVVCCVFQKNPNSTVMEHTGMGVGGGLIIHCSGEVKTARSTDKGWTHYAIPKGLNGAIPVPDWRPTIRRGSSGEDVKYCQSILISLGYDLGSYGADGKFGAKTEAAVKAFQKSKGLAADGVVGPLTWDALERAEPEPVKYYAVSIPHLTKEQAEALKKTYPAAEIKEE